MRRYPFFRGLLPGFRILIALSLAISGSPALAQPPAQCQCLWQGSFTQAHKQADVILIGEIINHKGNSADLKIHRRYPVRPNAIADYVEEVRFWGDSGNLCRPDISEFETGSQWILALNTIDEVPEGGFNPSTPSVSFGRRGDFYLSKCGANWLRIHEEFVSGNLVKGARWTWNTPGRRPVLLKLVESYLQGGVSEEILEQAASPNDKARNLMLQTKTFLHQQQ